MFNDNPSHPIHFLMRYSDSLLGVDTISEHKSVIEKHGYCWLEKFGLGVSAKIIDYTNHQLAKGIDTRIYLGTGAKVRANSFLVKSQNYSFTWCSRKSIVLETTIQFKSDYWLRDRSSFQKCTDGADRTTAVYYNTMRPNCSLGYQPPAPETLLPKERLHNQLKAA
jgi:hypothetical protein